jgi:hypothetical protein
VICGLTAKWLTKSVCRASLIIIPVQLLFGNLGEFILMQNSWIHTIRNSQGSPAVQTVRVSSNLMMSDVCAKNNNAVYSPKFGLQTRLGGGFDRSEQQI